MSRPDGPQTVADTVILRYFYLVDQAELMFALLGDPIVVPRVVFDPDEEANAPELSMSEITRSIHVQRVRSGDKGRDTDERKRAEDHAVQLEQVTADHTAGRITVTDLTDTETALFAKLASRGDSLKVGLPFALDAGEAACVALAVERSLALATDDRDGLTAFRSLRPRGKYERIRKMLKRAGESGLVDRAEANDIHQAMRNAGFWDKGRPFPDRWGVS